MGPAVWADMERQKHNRTYGTHCSFQLEGVATLKDGWEIQRTAERTKSDP